MSQDPAAARRKDQTSNATETIMRATDLKYAARLHSRGWVLIAPEDVAQETPDAKRFARPADRAD